MRIRLVLLSVVAVALSAAYLHFNQGATAQEEPPKPSFNSAGQLLRPDAELYRQWVYVGTPLTPNDLNPPEAPFPEFHNVYIHPGDYAYYKTNGRFRDRTVLIKELVTVGSRQAVSGNGYFMGEFTGLEVTIKDSRRFPDEPGNWAYFSFGHSYPLADTAEKFPTAACNSCHEASAADDLVFTQYYPVLRSTQTESPRGGAMAQNTPRSPGRSTVAATGPIPTTQAKLFEYLASGRYKSFESRESKRHPSAGPHTRRGLPVRVFFNSTLDRSLRAGNSSHPVTSAAVKEMYDRNGQLQGWAVMQKTSADSEGGQGWFWYEVTSTTDGSSPVAMGNGIALCFGCHSSGADFVLTGYPLK